MTFAVEVISTETIKPSSPTPPHLTTLKLSLLDQLMPLGPIPFILFYPASHEINLNHLKKSLSNVLTEFYPLAGRISDNLTIDCNDEGVHCFQTRVAGELDQLLSNATSDELTQLLPKDNIDGAGPRVLLSIQANMFDCGGIAVGVCMSHKAGDASSLSFFLQTWSAVSRGETTNIVSPRFDMTSFFPPNHILTNPSQLSQPTGKVVTKRFLFSASNIAALRTTCSEVENPTRVEVISALIWHCAISIANPTSAALHAVDLRGRMVPPLPSSSFGNLAPGAAMATTTPESNLDLPCLVGMLREAIRKIDGEYVKKLGEGDGIFEMFASVLKANELYLKGEMDLYSFTSWCRLPFYEADFGWGKPIWVSPANFPAKNIFALLDTKSGDGIEAWIALYEADMARFECVPQLIGFTSNDHRI